MKINTRNLKLAEVRYYDANNNGLEFTKPLAYVVLLNRGDTYVNLLNPGDICPIYRRIPSTTNAYGTDDYFGTKIAQVSGDTSSGEAWLLTDFDFTTKFNRTDIDVSDIEDYVLHSDLFFKDRVELAKDRSKRSAIAAIRMRKIIENDFVPMNSMLLFFEERQPQKVYQK